MKKKFNRRAKLIIRYQKIILFVISATCVTISAIIGWYLYEQQQNGIISEFQKDVSIQTISFYHGMTSNMSSLDSFSAGFSNQASLDYKLFEMNAKRVLETNKSIKILAFTAALPNSERSAIEKQQQSRYPNFRVFEHTASGKIITAGNRTEYYPIYFTFPTITVESIIGLDIANSQNILKALKSAEKTRHVNATLTYLANRKRNKLFLGIAPLYNEKTFTRKTDTTKASGFMLALFSLNQIFNSSVLSDDLNNVDLKVIDNNSDPTDKLLYHRSTNLPLNLNYSYTVPIPDDYDSLDWSLIATPSMNYISERQNKIPELAFLLGIAFSFILTSYLRILLKQTKVVERLVKKKTIALKLANEKLMIINQTDALTEIYNRRYMNMMLEQEWSRAIRNQSPLSFIFIDIDFFKLYNDNYGHLKGDECLKKVAQALASTLSRPADICVRYGGEEFAIILPETKRAEIVAEKCRQTIQNLAIEHKFSLISDVVTISIGVCTMIPQRESHPNIIIETADQALYQAKTAGRNQIISLSKLP